MFQEALKVLKGDGRNLLGANVAVAIDASLSNKEVRVAARDF